VLPQLKLLVPTAATAALLVLGLAAPAAADTPAPGPVPTPTGTPTAPPTPAPVPTPTGTPTTPPTPTPAPAPEPAATALSHYGGHSAGSRTLTISGSGFSGLSAVLVGGVAAPDLAVTSDTTATFTMGTAPEYQGARMPISLLSDDGSTIPTSIVYTYKVVDGLDKQMQYAFTHWNLFASPRFGYYVDNDCANFASQTLLARGWKQSSAWWNSGSTKAGTPVASASWVNTVALRGWLGSRPDLARHLYWWQRGGAHVGDVILFDWDTTKKGHTWAHTAVVSKVVTLPDGSTDIQYVAHTNNQRYGGSVGWLLQHLYPHMKVELWHLQK
jgi:hypothetical protein